MQSKNPWQPLFDHFTESLKMKTWARYTLVGAISVAVIGGTAFSAAGGVNQEFRPPAVSKSLMRSDLPKEA